MLPPSADQCLISSCKVFNMLIFGEICSLDSFSVVCQQGREEGDV